MVVKDIGSSRNSGATYDDWMDGVKARALRVLTVSEVTAVVHLLAANPVRPAAGRHVEGGEMALGAFCTRPGATATPRPPAS